MSTSSVAPAASGAAPGPDATILETFELDFQWPTIDPFLFCVHHLDLYPAGNENAGPVADLNDREIGSDFNPKDGWRMYHGHTVPGFPSHPHRGFETITVVRRGLVDHSDSLGARARYGFGDVQWLTAGGGIQHAEMFPLVNRDGDNPTELFQIWLNLPAASKMVDPHFTMFWADQIPSLTLDGVKVDVVAGALPGAGRPLDPPPASFASNPLSGVAVWRIELQPGARWVLPKADLDEAQRMLYFYAGDQLAVDGTMVDARTGMLVNATVDIELVAGDEPVEILMLQGRPIGEPVAQHGPFVMNTSDEIVQAFEDYRATQFGGWPWDRSDPVHGTSASRFAEHPDGRRETPTA